MQLEIKLSSAEESLMGFDYLYELHSMLMHKLSSRQPALAKDIHDGVHKNRIKLLVFSPFNSMPHPKLVQVEGEPRKRMLLGEKIWFRIASPWPELLNGLGEALLAAGSFTVGGKKFNVKGVSMVAPPEITTTMVWRPFGQSASICTVWTPKDAEKKMFRYPDYHGDAETPGCGELLKQNIVHKFQRLREIRPDLARAWLDTTAMDIVAPDKNSVQIEFLPLAAERAYRTVMNSGKDTTIRSWRCPVKVTAPLPLQRLIWAAGLGSMNSQGYGLVQEGKQC